MNPRHIYKIPFIHYQNISTIYIVHTQNICQLSDDSNEINLGLSTTASPKSPIVGFRGSLDCYKSFFAFFPNQNLTLTILNNQLSDSNEFKDLIEKNLQWTSQDR